MGKECTTEYSNSSLDGSVIGTVLGDCVSQFVFVETGTNIGAGTQVAFNMGFKTIFTMEKLDWLYEKAHKRFKDYVNVFTMHCDSQQGLPIVCNLVRDHCFFWLDAHNPSSAPLLKEIEIIKQRRDMYDRIAIDDVRIMKNPRDWGKTTTWDQLMSALDGFELRYFDSCNGREDILVAQYNWYD